MKKSYLVFLISISCIIAFSILLLIYFEYIGIEYIPKNSVDDIGTGEVLFYGLFSGLFWFLFVFLIKNKQTILGGNDEN